MKKTFLAIGLLLAVVIGVFGQTYQYRYVEDVNTVTGERSRTERKAGPVYITFTGRTCYISDREGRLISYGPRGTEHLIEIMYWDGNKQAGTYTFLKEENNLLIYKGTQDLGSKYLLFSKDYKRINVRMGYGNDTALRWGNSIDVYEQVEPPKPNEGPVEFY
jgi:hypothetical protein